MLAPAVAKLLGERWRASSFKAPHHLVFCNTLGRGLNYRDVGAAFRATVQRAAITATGRLSLHSLRHGYASLLIAKGPERRLRQPPARARQPDCDALDLRAPV